VENNDNLTSVIPEVIDANSLCKRLGISKSTLARWVKAGRIAALPIIKNNRRFLASDVAQLLKK